MDIIPFEKFPIDGAEVIFYFGAGEDPAAVVNADVEVALPDGSRWSGTLLTLPEIARLMDRWAVTGEELGGMFFQCRDLVIVRGPGVAGMLELVQTLVRAAEIQNVLIRLVDD